MQCIPTRLPLATAATASNEWIYKLCPLIPSFRISSFLSNSKDTSIPVTWVHQWLHLTNSTKKSGEKKNAKRLGFLIQLLFLGDICKNRLSKWHPISLTDIDYHAAMTVESILAFRCIEPSFIDTHLHVNINRHHSMSKFEFVHPWRYQR